MVKRIIRRGSVFSRCSGKPTPSNAISPCSQFLKASLFVFFFFCSSLFLLVFTTLFPPTRSREARKPHLPRHRAISELTRLLLFEFVRTNTYAHLFGSSYIAYFQLCTLGSYCTYKTFLLLDLILIISMRAFKSGCVVVARLIPPLPTEYESPSFYK